MQINFNLMQISRKAGTAGDKRILLIFLGKTQESQLLSIPILRISTFTSQGPFSEFRSPLEVVDKVTKINCWSVLGPNSSIPTYVSFKFFLFILLAGSVSGDMFSSLRSL